MWLEVNGASCEEKPVDIVVSFSIIMAGHGPLQNAPPQGEAFFPPQHE
jgi:hypothetical protein